LFAVQLLVAVCTTSLQPKPTLNPKHIVQPSLLVVVVVYRELFTTTTKERKLNVLRAKKDEKTTN